MNVSAEQRLRDLFDAIDAQTTPGPLREMPVGRSSRPLLIAAACVMMVVAGALLVSTRQAAPTAPVATLPPATINGDAFNTSVAEFCHTLTASRNGVEPRFATPEAYVTVVAARRETISMFVSDLAALPRPDDAPDLPSQVVAELRAVRDLLDEVEQLARTGQIKDAASAWRDVDPAIDAAIAPLGAHGAVPCNQEGVRP